MNFEGIVALCRVYAFFTHSFDILEEKLSSTGGGRQVPTHPAIAIAWPHITGSSSYSKGSRSVMVLYLLLSLLLQFKVTDICGLSLDTKKTIWNGPGTGESFAPSVMKVIIFRSEAGQTMGNHNISNSGSKIYWSIVCISGSLSQNR